MLKDYLQQCDTALRELYAQPQRNTLMALCRQRLLDKPHGDLPRWMAALNALPEGRRTVILRRIPCALESPVRLIRQS